ncbi:hypothetical protein Nepgr_032973 [Nepenthes gracilis]|uniref:Uncharacterized protein n=1 Tax=Nepenthes gracilis TaxID=150966 RepID=A0AAD3TJP2_NEPGR|nr:hypothetical protein Nepgr_032973 [Nepenthes gracilis]
MSSSFQTFPPPGPPPPPPPPPRTVFPTTVTGTLPPSHSKGSFGAVFIVLAVIVIVSAVACVLNRLCSKRSHRSDLPTGKHSHPDHSARANETDFEFGFDKGIPTGKPAASGGDVGELRSENRTVDDGERRGFA